MIIHAQARLRAFQVLGCGKEGYVYVCIDKCQKQTEFGILKGSNELSSI